MANFTLDSLINMKPSVVSRDLSGYITYLYSAPKIGKAQPNSTVIPTPFGNTTIGNLKVGDMVYDRTGRPTKVLEVFPRGELDVYKVTLEDGRSTLCNDDHIFSVLTLGGNLVEKTVRQMIDYGLTDKGGRAVYSIPINEAVEKKEKDFSVDPYVVGIFLGDGCCTERQLTLSSNDEEIVERVVKKIPICKESYKNPASNYSWTFLLKEPLKNINNVDILKIQTKIFFKEFLEDICVPSDKKRIPRIYFEGSIEQRLELLRGLMDTDGSIVKSSGKLSFTSISEGLIEDVRELAYSLGFRTSVTVDKRTEKYKNGFCATVNFNISNEQKYLFFNLERKKEIALKFINIPQRRHYERVLIKEIEKLNYKAEMTCILVDNPEHLYLTEDFIVTHNTTVAKDMGALILSFEDGTRAMSGAYAQIMQSWGDVRTIARLAKDPKFKERYKAIAVDTIDVAATLCEKWVCSQHGVEKLGDIPWGQGYTLLKKEIETIFRELALQGYSILFISHDKEKTITRPDGTEYTKIVPTISDSVNNIIKNMADIIGYGCVDWRTGERVMYLRSNDGTIDCGTRFPYMAEKIPFSYQSLVDALNEAIDREAEMNGANAITNQKVVREEAVTYNFDEIMEDFNVIIKTLSKETNFTEFWAPRITEITDKILGKGKKVSQCSREQVELLSLIVDELKAMVSEHTKA